MLPKPVCGTDLLRLMNLVCPNENVKKSKIENNLEAGENNYLMAII